MFSNLLVLLITSLSYAGAAIGIGELKNNLVKRNPFLPQHWDSASIAPKEGQKLLGNAVWPTGYLIANLHFGSPDCSTKQGTYNTATGVCFVGSSTNGTNTGSVVYVFTQVTAESIAYNSIEFSSVDCTGPSIGYVKKVPLGCYNPEGTNDGFVYEYTTNGQLPEGNFGEGLMFR